MTNLIKLALTNHAELLKEITGKISHADMAGHAAKLVADAKALGADIEQQAKVALFQVESKYNISVA